MAATAAQDVKNKKLLEEYEIPDDPASNPPVETAQEPVEQVEEVVETPVEPAKPKHPSWLTRAAKLAGLDQAEVDSMDSAALERAVEITAKANERDSREQAIAKAARDPETGRFLPRDQQVEQPDPESEFTLESLGIDPKKWDSETPATTILQEALKPLVKQINELKSNLEGFQRQEMQRQQTANLNELDQLFDSNSKIYGKGSREELDNQSDEFSRRLGTIDVMKRIMNANPNLSLKQAFQKASKQMFGAFEQPETPDPVTEPAKKTINDPHGYRNGSTIQPANREPKPEPKGVKTAVASVNRILKNRVTDDDDDEFNDLPDR